MDVVDKILSVFKENQIRAGGTLEKKKLMAVIATFSSEEKSQVRNVWHTLVGNGIILEVNPLGPTLTELGEGIVYGES